MHVAAVLIDTHWCEGFSIIQIYPQIVYRLTEHIQLVDKLFCVGIYSGKKKYVNPLELPAFLHKLVIQFYVIFI